MLSLLPLGCATPDKVVVLRDMPSTLVIHRGESAAQQLCKRDNAWGCAQRKPDQDSCIIALNWIRGRGTDIHELAHCAGADEKTAQEITEPE